MNKHIAVHLNTYLLLILKDLFLFFAHLLLEAS